MKKNTGKYALLVACFFLGACGDSEPCQNAVDARLGCLAEAGVSVEDESLDAKADGICAVVGVASAFKQEINDWADCQSRVLDNSDCSTPELAQEALARADECERPF